jgi:hypothetical protein
LIREIYNIASNLTKKTLKVFKWIGRTIKLGVRKVGILIENVGGKIGFRGGEVRKLVEELDDGEFESINQLVKPESYKKQLNGYRQELKWCAKQITSLSNNKFTLLAGTVSAQATRSCPSGGFSPGEWEKHFNKHKDDFPGITPEGYLQKILDIFGRKNSNVVKKVDPNTGVIRIYDKLVNEFATFNANGTPRTIFKPDPAKHNFPTNLDYWNSQPGLEVFN